MSKLLGTDGKILQIKSMRLTPASLFHNLSGEYDAHELLSGDLLIFNIAAQEDGRYEKNELATSMSGKPFFGPVILCEPRELD